MSFSLVFFLQQLPALASGAIKTKWQVLIEGSKVPRGFEVALSPSREVTKAFSLGRKPKELSCDREPKPRSGGSNHPRWLLSPLRG